MSEPIFVAIKKVSIVEFSYKEDSLPNPLPHNLKFEFQRLFKLDVEKNSFVISLGACFFIDDDLKEKIAYILVDNFFEVGELSKYIDEHGNITFTEEVWATLFGVSVSHTRALFYERLSNTKLQIFIIPLIDLKHLTQAFTENVKVENK